VAEREPQRARSVIVQAESPLIGVPMDNDGQEAVAYFVAEEEADQAMRQEAAQPAIKLAGVWSDLDGDAMLDGLDRLRHDSAPTPPITSI
jgi:hypothetical protein